MVLGQSVSIQGKPNPVRTSVIRIKLSFTLAPFNRPFLTNYALLFISYGPNDMDLTRFNSHGTNIDFKGIQHD